MIGIYSDSHRNETDGMGTEVPDSTPPAPTRFFALPAKIGNDSEFENCTSLALSQSGDRLLYALADGTIRMTHLTAK